MTDNYKTETKPSDTKSIQVSARNESSGKPDYVTVKITDNGSGRVLGSTRVVLLADANE